METSSLVNLSTITDREIAEHDKALLVTFEFYPEEYQEGGERKFRNVEYIRIRPPGKAGTLTEVFRKADDNDRARFAARYQAWKAGEEAPIDGTPLKEWPEISPADLAACKSERLQTVEQLAESSDAVLSRSGVRVSLKYRARDWIQARKDNSFVNELRDEIETLKKENEGLKERMELLLKHGDKDTDTTGQQRKRRGRPRKTDKPG